MSPLSRRGFLQFSVAAAVVGTAACSSDEPETSPDKRFPPGSFGASATAEAVTEGVNLSGKTALVTGCNSGLGYETLAVLARRGVHVIGTGRTLEIRQLQRKWRGLPAHAGAGLLGFFQGIMNNFFNHSFHSGFIFKNVMNIIDRGNRGQISGRQKG